MVGDHNLQTPAFLLCPPKEVCKEDVHHLYQALPLDGPHKLSFLK
jgi:hypothetical protein